MAIHVSFWPIASFRRYPTICRLSGARHAVTDGVECGTFAGAQPALSYSAAAPILAGRKAGMTSFANRSRSSNWTSRGVPSGVAHTTRSTPG